LRKLQNLNVILDIQMVFVKYKNENQLFIVFWSCIGNLKVFAFQNDMKNVLNFRLVTRFLRIIFMF